MARWLNDHFATGSSPWAGLSEADVAERLAHMMIEIDGRERGLGSLLTQAAVEDATAFRRGELGAQRGTLARGGTVPAEGSVTVAGLLSSMWGRVGARLRPALLRETRASLAAQVEEGGSGRPFMLDAELLVLAILDGRLASVLAAVREEGVGAGGEGKDVNRPPCPLPWPAGVEWVLSCVGPVQVGVCPDADPEAVTVPCVYVPLSSPYLRCVLHGLASFYGLLADSVPVEECPVLWPGAHGESPDGARALRFVLPTPRTRAARVERQAITAVRAALAEAWGGGGQEGEPVGAEGAALDEARDVPQRPVPVVPLLHVHVRTISESTVVARRTPKFSFGKQYKVAMPPTSSGRSTGSSSRRAAAGAAVAPPPVPQRHGDSCISLTLA